MDYAPINEWASILACSVAQNVRASYSRMNFASNAN